MSWISDIFSPVVNWVTDTAGEAVAAVSASAFKGAVYGAVAGAAYSAIAGKDIGRGALQGAAAGGMISGVTSSLMGLADVQGYSWENQLEKMGFGDTADQDIMPELGKTESDKLSVTKKYGKKPDQSTDTDAWWKVDKEDKGKIYAGLLGGAAQGASNYILAEKRMDAEKELLDYRERLADERIKNNKAATGFQQKTAKLNVKTWWEDRIRQ